MKKNILILLVLCTLSNTSFSQSKIKGNKNVTIVKTPLKPFNKIKVNNDFKIVLVQSKKSSIEIETDENLHQVIDFSIVDSILSISTSNKLKSKRLNITVSYNKPLEEIILNEDAEMEALNTIKSPNFVLKINDYSKADLIIMSQNFRLINNNRSRIQLRSKTKLNIESVNANLSLNESSNSDISIRTDSLQVLMKENSFADISGSASFAQANFIDSSKFKGKNFIAKQCNSVIKDVADFSIQCMDTINIEASEKSSTEIYGNPKILLVKFEGSSKLFKKEL
ncbi:GIN domain-containing protein [Polaribacter sp.]|uniref:GIN domain-containing protein n=1 Tax=Polaribacter sp. TaxID=1920175 RepID=UPI003EF53666